MIFRIWGSGLWLEIGAHHYISFHFEIWYLDLKYQLHLLGRWQVQFIFRQKRKSQFVLLSPDYLGHLVLGWANWACKISWIKFMLSSTIRDFLKDWWLLSFHYLWIWLADLPFLREHQGKPESFRICERTSKILANFFSESNLSGKPVFYW